MAERYLDRAKRLISVTHPLQLQAQRGGSRLAIPRFDGAKAAGSMTRVAEPRGSHGQPQVEELTTWTSPIRLPNTAPTGW